MKKKVCLLLALFVSLIVFTACAPTEQPAEPPAEQPAEESAEQPSEDPPDQEQPGQNGDNGTGSEGTWIVSFEESIMIEGMKEPITLNYFDGDRNFITYVPEDMIAETVSSGEGDTYWFYANFGGTKNEDAYLNLTFYPHSDEPDLTGDAGMFTMQGLTMEPVDESEKRYDWSSEEYRSVDGGAYSILGNHEGESFSFLMHYPPEFEEGFVPRANKIIEHLYWTDTNEYLTPQ